MARIDEYTPIGRWLIKACERHVDPHTKKPITWRQASIQAGFKDPNSVWRFIVKRQNPDDASCYRLAEFFSVPPERTVNPDYLLYLAGHRREEAPEFLTPSINLDDLMKAKDPQLYDLLRQIVALPDDQRHEMYDMLKKLLKFVMGKS